MPLPSRTAVWRRSLLAAAFGLGLGAVAAPPLASASEAAPARVIVTFKPGSAMARLQPLTLAGDAGRGVP